jgi:hypothetical protein
LNLIRVIPAKGQDISMQASLIIARLIGPVFAMVGIGMLASPDAYRQIGEQFLGSYPLIYLSGVLLFAAGLAILNWHHVWTRDWRALITAIGWIMALAGVWRIMAPPFVVYVGSSILSGSNFFMGAGLILLALGGFITFKGYIS